MRFTFTVLLGVFPAVLSAQGEVQPGPGPGALLPSPAPQRPLFPFPAPAERPGDVARFSGSPGQAMVTCLRGVPVDPRVDSRMVLPVPRGAFTARRIVPPPCKPVKEPARR